jgi:site-specific DNA recombinase
MPEMKNIGLWIRVSTDMQVQDESPEHHEKRARLYAEAKGWNVVTVYRLDALSGKSIMEYPETKRMLKDIKQGTITGIIFSKLARLARNTKELLEISEIFRECNADLISLAEAIDTSSPAGRLFFTVIAAMAQWEREEIADRVAKSVPIRAMMGKQLGGQASLGYKWEDNKLVIEESEAPARKMVYELFKKLKRIKSTATELNNLGYRTRGGGKFTGTTVERLIKDPTAKGIKRANYTKSMGEGKGWKLKPESDWIEQPCPAIVTTELWDECNAQLDSTQKKREPLGRRAVHLFAGFVHCSCGSKMYIYAHNPTYKCKQCKRKIPGSDLEEVYHEQLKPFLLVDADMQTIAEKSNNNISEKETQLKAFNSEYEKLKKKVQSQLELYSEGILSKTDFTAFYSPLKEQLSQMEYQLPILEAELDFLKIQQISSDTILDDVKSIYDNWSTLPFDEKRSIIETITERIEIDTDSINISLAYLPSPYLSSETLEKGNATMPMRLF